MSITPRLGEPFDTRRREVLTNELDAPLRAASRFELDRIAAQHDDGDRRRYAKMGQLRAACSIL